MKTKIVGLTGGIGSGKTTLIQYIASKNIPVYIADEAGKRVMEQPVIIKKITDLFGNHVLLNIGFPDRKKIAEIVFTDAAKLQALNHIIHPAVGLDFETFQEKHQNAKIIVKESAVLFESGAYKKCDAAILITAPENVRIERVMKRDKVSETEVRNRIKNQLSDEEKSVLADYIVTNVDLQKAYSQIDEILEQISAE